MHRKLKNRKQKQNRKSRKMTSTVVNEKQAHACTICPYLHVTHTPDNEILILSMDIETKMTN
jgi:hypothetical protein